MSWRDPRQNGGFWEPFLVLWDVSLPENVEKWTFRCHVRPNRAKMCCVVFVRSVRSPWTPPDLPNFNLNYEKTVFVKNLIFSFSRFVFCQCRHSVNLLPARWLIAPRKRDHSTGWVAQDHAHILNVLQANPDDKAWICMQMRENRVFHKNCFFIIQVEIREVWRCPGWPHGPYKDSATHFRAIWSYMASKSPLFNIFR